MGTPDQMTAARPAARWGGRAGALAGSCHPGPVVAVTAMMSALAVSAGHSAGRCAVIAAAVLTGQLSVGWCNDAFDVDRDIATAHRGKPLVDGAIGPAAVWVAAFCALTLCVPLSLACGPTAGAVHLAGVAGAWAYDLRLKATVWSWAPYALGFAALPAFVALSLPGHPWPAWWVVTAGALLGTGAHLGNVLPDIRADLATGVRGWPQRLGPGAARLLLPVPLVAASAVLALGPPGPPGTWGATGLVTTALLATAGTLLGRRREPAAFAAAVAVAVVDVALLLLRGTALT